MHMIEDDQPELPLHEPAAPPTDCTNDGAGIWRLRRRFIYVTTGFCMGVIAYVLHYNMKGSVAETAVTMSFITLMSTIGSYCFAATWDDHSARQFGGRMRGPRMGRRGASTGEFGW